MVHLQSVLAICCLVHRRLWLGTRSVFPHRASPVFLFECLPEFQPSTLCDVQTGFPKRIPIVFPNYPGPSRVISRRLYPAEALDATARIEKNARGSRENCKKIRKCRTMFEDISKRNR